MSSHFALSTNCLLSTCEYLLIFCTYTVLIVIENKAFLNEFAVLVYQNNNFLAGERFESKNKFTSTIFTHSLLTVCRGTRTQQTKQRKIAAKNFRKACKFFSLSQFNCKRYVFLCSLTAFWSLTHRHSHLCRSPARWRSNSALSAVTKSTPATGSDS